MASLLILLPAFAQEPSEVVTTVIADMARNVAGEGGDAVSVTKPGAEMHDYEPTPQDIAALPEDHRWLVTCGGTFRCPARDPVLQELDLWPGNADRQGTPRPARAVIGGVRDQAIPSVFCESTLSSAPAEQVARKTGAAIGGVLCVNSLSAGDGPVPTCLDLPKVATETSPGGLSPAN